MRKLIRDAALNTPRVDTHGHLWGTPGDLRKATVEPSEIDRSGRAAPLRMLAVGCRELYGIDVGSALSAEAPPEVFERAAALRQLGRQEMFARAFEAAGIETQLCFCDCRLSDAADKRAIAPHVRLLAYIDQALVGQHQEGDTYIAALERVHGRLGGLGDLLEIVDRSIDAWPSAGVVGMKVGLAYYDHGLDLRMTSQAGAERAFGRREDMSSEDAACVRDFALRHAFDACLRNNLPVVIHTGFLAWGAASIRGANPAFLQPVLMDRRWAGLTFVLLHGGYPYTGETCFLAARIPNVVVDFTWLPWLSPTRFRSALAEWIENVPFERFVWGSDSNAMPESIVGTDRLTRELIAEVLDALCDQGLLDVRRAIRFIELSFRENARRIFRLGER